MKKFLLFAVAALALFGCKEAASPILSIEGGQVQGEKADLKGVYVYRGIPYAAPPIKDLRWKAPQPVIPWEGVLQATEFGHPSYQAVHYPGNYFTEWGYGEEKQCSEDCLYLNVWTNKPGVTDAKLPVAMWIHGGGFREGFGSEPEFDAQEWAARDVVLVSINYRLGVFGFLTHPELSAEDPHGVSGNYGILDMIQALKWIKNNIAQFGGDPNNVMIFGQSAGAGAVRTLSESPLTEGLFQKAVIMSGGGLDAAAAAAPKDESMTPLQKAEQNSKAVLDWAGLTDLKKMRAASTEMIYTLSNIYRAVNGAGSPSISQSPVVDGYVSNYTFDEAAVRGTLHDIPYMMGYTMNDLDGVRHGIVDFGINRDAQGAKAYLYEFCRPLPDDGSHPEDTLKGAFHSSDLWFVFKSLKHCWRPWTDGDWALADQMITAWTNFAKTGDPNGAGVPQWDPCTMSSHKLMIFKLDENDKAASAMGDAM